MNDDDHEFARQLFADETSSEIEIDQPDPLRGAHVPSEGTSSPALGSYSTTETLRSIFNDGNPF